MTVGGHMKLLSFLFTIVMVALATGCGKMNWCEDIIHQILPGEPKRRCTTRNIATKYDGDATEYIRSFSQDALDRDISCYKVKSITITNDSFDADSDTIGWCKQYSSIALRKDFWDISTNLEKMALVYHELGHCALGLGHTDNGPAIMNSSLLSHSYLSKHWDELINHLFTGVKK